jgi:GT2 family glycosyltransferase
VVSPHQNLSDVTLVIPTVGRPLLDDCLESIRVSQAWPAALLVVDQSSSSAIADHVNELRRRGLNTTHLPMRGSGVAAAMNHGLRHVRTPLVAVTHDDCLVNERWLRCLHDRVRNEGLVVVTGRVLPEGGAEVPSVITSTIPATYTRPLPDRDVLFPANMLFPYQVWRAVGPMDEDPLLLVAEDNEWAYRVLRAGIPIVYEPEAVVVHVAWRGEAALKDVTWAYARAQGAFYGKYLRRRADLHLARRAAVDLLRGLWWVARGSILRDRALAERGRAGTLGLAQGLVSGIFRARRIVGPAAGSASSASGDHTESA